MIIATSGHVDHGKTRLVKAMTSIDTDRLATEKARGLTIDLGFAYLHKEQTSLGFVDVPGHIKFISNMLAGVAAIDFGMLVIAADDGPMPQTREHLAILELLGIRAGCVVVTKIDRVDSKRQQEADAEIQSLVAGTAFETRPRFYTSSESGEGIDELLDYLWQVAQSLSQRASGAYFRLAIDRSFNIKGSGVVVTGAVFSGQARQGEEVWLQPLGQKVRIRQIHCQNRVVDAAGMGDRAAINIAGQIEQAEVKRGFWLTSNPNLPFTNRIDILLTNPATNTNTKPLQHGMPVHIHAAAQHVTGRLYLLENRQLVKGESGLAQLTMHDPINCCAGDRIIIRDQAASITLGGGTVLDAFSPRRGRSKPDRLSRLHAVNNSNEPMLSVLKNNYSGIKLDELEANFNQTLPTTVQVLVTDGRVFDSNCARNASSRVQDTVMQSKEPLLLGHLAKTLNINPQLVRYIADQLVKEGVLEQKGNHLQPAGRQPALSPAELTLWQKVEPLLAESPMQPPVLHDLAKRLGLPVAAVEKLLNPCIKAELLVKPVKNRYFLRPAINQLRQAAIDLAALSAEQGFTVIEFRDKTGIGRNLCIQILEYFDSRGFTKRLGDRRIIQDSNR